MAIVVAAMNPEASLGDGNVMPASPGSRRGSDPRKLVDSSVAVEAVGDVYYSSHLGAADRALFGRRTGRAGDRVNSIARSLVRRVWKGNARGTS